MPKERITKRQEEFSTQVTELKAVKNNDPHKKKKTDIAELLEILNDKITEYSTPNEMGEEKKLSLEFYTLRHIYKETLNSIDSLSNQLSTFNKNINAKYTEGQKITGKETKQYKANMADLDNYNKLAKKLSKDLGAIDKAIKKKEPVTLKSVYEKSRVNSGYKIKEGSEVEKFGTAQNTRLKMTIVDKDGNEKEGFFTADTSLTLSREEDMKKTFTERKASYGPFAPDISYNKMEEIFQYMSNNPDIIEDILLDKQKYMVMTNDRFIESFNTASTPRGGEMVRRYANDPQKQKAFLDMFSALAEGMNRHSVKEVGGINEKSRLNRRNAAMSSVADYLGCGELLAESENIKIKIDGKTVKGTFMEDSKAADSRRPSPDNPLFFCTAESVENLPLKKQLADLQILDYLCGNYDRNDGNMHYKCEEKDGIMVIKGVKGIDNDTCMGSEKGYEGIGMSAFSLDNMRVITKSMAEKIKNTDAASLKQMLYGYDLKADELDAMAGRLEKLKTKISEGEEFYSKGYGKGTLVGTNMKIVDDSELDRISFSELSKRDNIFKTVKTISDPHYQSKSYRVDSKAKVYNSAWNMTGAHLGDFNKKTEKLLKDDKGVYNSSPQYGEMVNKTKSVFEKMATINGPVVEAINGQYKISDNYLKMKIAIQEAILACDDYMEYKHARNQREHKTDFDARPHKLSTAEKRWDNAVKTKALLEKQMKAFQKFEKDFASYRNNMEQYNGMCQNVNRYRAASVNHPNVAARAKMVFQIEYDNHLSRAVYRLKKEYDALKDAKNSNNKDEIQKHELKYGYMLGYALTAFSDEDAGKIRDELKKHTGEDITKSNDELFREGCAKELIHTKLYGNSPKYAADLAGIKTDVDDPVASLMKEEGFKEYMKSQEKAFSAKNLLDTQQRKSCMNRVGELKDEDIPKSSRLESKIKVFGEKVLEVSQKAAQKAQGRQPGKK